ncbi:hypothetical protein F66182_9139 [Fusarium sp. NRRL 66182]|nr:hypothetical protein F66182_9139 [Fusarium sp. NRRL 66182]
MGIPRLISTLEPYVEHRVLNDEHVVVDGPGLAYHILSLCHRDGIPQPSYKLLGQKTLVWLDELIHRRVKIEAVYFDGYLPKSKETVRMQRMAKSLCQLKTSHSSDSHGFLPAYFSVSDETSPGPSAARTTRRVALPPSFHVPAIIDVLRTCPRYAELVHLVPGEADAYCAKHLSESGGTVLTSDSDLLVHDLGSGSVIFFRDIIFDHQVNVICASFCPAQICVKLKLASSADMCRFAYERKYDPHSTVPQLLQECAQPVKDEAAYIEFCHEYLDHAIAPMPVSTQGTSIQIGGLDPRISEMVLQLGYQDDQRNDPHNDVKMFLPILLECPSRGSAWEKSTPIRQLAYTIARWVIPGVSCTIQEYRRVNTIEQRGRKVPMIPQEAAKAWAQDLVRTMSRIKAGTRGDTARAWHILCLTLDIRYCIEEETHSHTLQTLEESLKPPTFKRVSWDIIHFVAHLQAAYYSFRLLKQILSLQHSRNILPELQDMLSSLPSLSEFPDVGNTLKFLQKSGEEQVYRTVAKFVPLPGADVNIKLKRIAQSKKQKASKEGALKGKAGATRPVNLFDVLSR